MICSRGCFDFLLITHARADVCIIGIAGSSGSGKSTLSHAIVSKLNLPWVVILSMVALVLLLQQHVLMKGTGLLLQIS